MNKNETTATTQQTENLNRLAKQAVRDFLYMVTDGATDATGPEALAALTAAIEATR